MHLNARFMLSKKMALCPLALVHLQFYTAALRFPLSEGAPVGRGSLSSASRHCEERSNPGINSQITNNQSIHLIINQINSLEKESIFFDDDALARLCGRGKSGTC